MHFLGRFKDPLPTPPLSTDFQKGSLGCLFGPCLMLFGLRLTSIPDQPTLLTGQKEGRQPSEVPFQAPIPSGGNMGWTGGVHPQLASRGVPNTSVPGHHVVKPLRMDCPLHHYKQSAGLELLSPP